MPTIEFTDRDPKARSQAATSVLVRATVAAGHAPSVFNTQPWRWHVAEGVAELRADRRRQLAAVDPDGRLLTISCGAALHHARTALAGAGVIACVARLPEPTDKDLLARIRTIGVGDPRPDAIRKQMAMALRRTDRRPFAELSVPEPALDALRAAAEAEGARLRVLEPEQVATLGAASALAAMAESAGAAYQTELAVWTQRPAVARDGVRLAAFVDGGSRPVPPRHLGPVRPDDGGRLDRHARYAVLVTETDAPAAWLAAGEALSAVLLAAVLARLAASPLSEAIEVPAARQLLLDLFDGIGHPMLALRIGVPGEGARPAATPRRAVDDVVEVAAER
jgi:nitroreductase